MQTQEPNALLCEEEERQKQAEIAALEEMLSAANMFVSSVRKLLVAKGRTFKNNTKLDKICDTR